ncbi:MAG: phage tail protein [Acidobacteriaceae bacterium]|nr:phage tail protein [Acidobacteriaceae bacterium]MBV9781988.1 phage tail protein [Acidobacteriaceae bacterium]
MGTINDIKQLAESDTPLLFFQCILPSGDIENWSTHSLVFNGQPYSARILKHNLFDLQLSADDAMDGLSQLSLTLANADSALSELNAGMGFKGSQLTVYFAFADLQNQTITTESTVLFRGIAGDPDEITEDALTLSFTNKLSLQRIPLPEVRVQRSCAWNFPVNQEQRSEAKDGGTSGRYSRFYRCGYSADIPGGVGNLNAGQPFTSCDLSRTQCQQRGMFDIDQSGRVTRRFGGFEFVPSAIMVRTSGDKTSHVSPLLDNSAKYNDPVPIVYGTGWLKAPVIFARNDGNLTHMEVLLGMGTIQNVLKVVVNDVEIPQAVQAQNMTTTGWYNVFTNGSRAGSFNLDFTDSNGQPLGDPYGSISAASIVVPNRISSGRSLPTVEVLLQGMQIDSYTPDGVFQSTSFTNNPAWVILDLLRRCGWSLSDLDLQSFSSAAEFCSTLINTTDLNGNDIQVPRFECNLILTKRQSAATIVRGIRVASSLMLRYGPTGLLQLLPETTIAAQQPTLPDGGNSTEPLNGGWPAYEFSDAAGPFSGIVRNANGGSTVRLSSRSIAETSNRLSVEFQDESNEYQQDSLTVVDADDAGLIGYEISSQSTALGVANFSQANRVLLRQLDKSTKGNLFVQFQTSFRALKVRPGDIIALTYLKEGFSRVPLRVVKLSPSMNYQLVTVLAQIHDDDWYSDNPTVLGGAGRQTGSENQMPRPLIGVTPHLDANGEFEYFNFNITDAVQTESDGAATDILTVSFTQPTKPSLNWSNLPLVSLSPQYSTTGGSLAGGNNLYYAVTAVDEAGNEGALSFTVPAMIPAGSNNNVVSLTGLSFPRPAASFNIYRGTTPQMLYRIAAQVPLSSGFSDAGLPPQPAGPPDVNFDHANFYYRFEYAGPFTATVFSATSIGSADMGATNLAYSGMVVRIIEGTGRGQERVIAANDQTTLTVTQAWSINPDLSSTFVVAEGSWKFGAVSMTSIAQFEITYRAGTVIHVSGRGANVLNQEGTPDLCPLTRWALGAGESDTGVAGAPNFSVAVPGGGNVTIFGIGFNDLTNTSSISTGTLQLFSWNELYTPTSYSLTAPIDATSTIITLNGIPNPQPEPGDIVQVGSELMSIISVDPSNNSYEVTRSALNSEALADAAGEPVFHLQRLVVVLPFARGFFEDRASNNYVHTVTLPDIRIAGAQLYVTNSFGDSQASSQSYTAYPDNGLRTLSGGQFSIQVSGYLATEQNAAPPLLVEANHAVRDLRATLSQPAQGYTTTVTVLQNGTPYGGDSAVLSIAPGELTSNIVDGVTLPPLEENAALTVNIALDVDPSSGTPSTVSPGRDLSVTIRF